MQKERINEVVAASVKPQVEINRNDDDNTVEINVKHIRAITKLHINGMRKKKQ